MRNIFLGTTSQAKLDIVKSLLGENYNVTPVNVDSGITDQPLDEDTTIRGAINRAKRAIKPGKAYEFSVGLEGGLAKINGLFYLVCVAALIDCSGNVYVGISRKLPLPKEVSNEIENGKQFGEAIREFMKNTKETSPSFIEHIQELIDRKKSFSEALNSALLIFKFKKVFVSN
jgi:non-canonical (house-cleaning) NTP pyrophosphatase